MRANTIEEFFGTLQQSVVASWRKHLKTDKYSAHMALDEYYKEMPELVDTLIENYMGIHGKVESYKNILSSNEMDAITYLEEMRALVTDGRKKFFAEDAELQSDCDAILSQIDSTLYKLRELSENCCTGDNCDKTKKEKNKKQKTLKECLLAALQNNDAEFVKESVNEGHNTPKNTPSFMNGMADKERIDNWLKKMGVKNYRLNGDLSVSTYDSVDLSGKSIAEIPSYIQFNEIGGDGVFDISDNDLRTLRGCPAKCYTFRCKNNPKLRTLRGGPQEVVVYNCSDNNLTSLSGAPEHCSKFLASNNKQLKSLVGGPKCICPNEETFDNGVFSVCDCGLTSLEGAPKVEGTFKCTSNPGKFTKYLCQKEGVKATSYVADTNIKQMK